MKVQISYEIEIAQETRHPNDNEFCFRREFKKKNDANYWAQLLSDFFHGSIQKLYITVAQLKKIDGIIEDKLQVKKWATKEYLEEKEKKGLF